MSGYGQAALSSGTTRAGRKGATAVLSLVVLWLVAALGQAGFAPAPAIAALSEQTSRAADAPRQQSAPPSASQRAVLQSGRHLEQAAAPANPAGGDDVALAGHDRAVPAGAPRDRQTPVRATAERLAASPAGFQARAPPIPA